MDRVYTVTPALRSPSSMRPQTHDLPFHMYPHRRSRIHDAYRCGPSSSISFNSLYSSGCGELQGSDQTWMAAYLLAQSAINSAQFVICDPHAGDEESLASRVQPLAFLCDIAEDEQSILQALKLANEEVQRCKDGDPNRCPLIVAVDEWTSLWRGELAEQLPRIVEDFQHRGSPAQHPYHGS